MKAQDTLTSTHELEESGMTRSQSEAIARTIVAAVEPLATKADLDSLREESRSGLKNFEAKMDDKFAAVNGAMDDRFAAVNDKIAGLKEQMATKADIAAVKTSIVSIKVWVLSGVLVTVGSILALAFGVVI